MKMVKILSVAILFLIASVTLVSATHISSVTMTPNSWAKNTLKSVSISVTNNGPDAIKKIELIVPKDSNQVPIYNVGEITKPEGWTYSSTGDPISKITWVATGSGISSGSSLDLFAIDATSPSASGNYQWPWTTTDSKGAAYSSSSTTTVGQAPVSYFVISGVPASSVAGTSFKFNVKAYGDDGQIKTDYTGKVAFSSTDPNAVLPTDYTYLSTDYGSKDFTVTYKTTGDQTFTVKDSNAGVSKVSIKTSVKAGTITDIGITPEDKKAASGEKIEYKVLAKDTIGNVIDVTDKATITIDKKAGGNWNKSVYTVGNEGIWVVIASYNSMVDGTTLTVSGKAETVVTPTEKINITPTVPYEKPPATEDYAISMSAPETVNIAPGANDTIILTVNNDGQKRVTGVEVKVSGVPSDWVSVYPLLNDIPAQSSKDFLVIVFVPQNETETKTIEFTAKANEGVTALKSTELILSSAPTGSFALPKNLLQLGVVIIAVAAVVIIGWELWFKKSK